MNIVFLGAAGSGKGTQSSFLIDQYDLVHISSGDLLRSEIAANSELGLKAKVYVDKGDLVPDNIVIAMVKDAIDRTDSGILLDGFPRNVEQAKDLDRIFKELNRSIDHVIYLEVSFDVLAARLLERGRADDTQNAIMRRLEVFQETIESLKTYYSEHEKLRIVDGTEPVKNVLHSIKKILDN